MSGAAGVTKKQAPSDDSLAGAHALALDLALHYLSQTIPGTQEQGATYFDCCLEHIANGVAISQFDGAIRSFLGRADWGESPKAKELFARYVAAGQIRPNELINTRADVLGIPHLAPPVCLPIEAAIVNGNVGALLCLLESGATIDLVPTRDWRKSPDLPAPRDAIELAVAGCIRPNRIQEMVDILTRHATMEMMERRINASPAPTANVARPRNRVV